MKRSCGTCTKCCEGWLKGEALGYRFHQGKPCHFVSIGKGCTVYEKRPKDPCSTYTCSWLKNEEIPEWMKPSEINAILDFQITDGVEYMRVTEAGLVLDSRVLTWVIQYALSKNINLTWTVNGWKSWIGSTEFNELMLREG